LQIPETVAMTGDQAEEVQTLAEQFLNSREGRELDVGNPNHFEQLVGRVRPGVSGVAEDDLRVVTAMCWLGPGDAGIPRECQRNDLLRVLRASVTQPDDRIKRVMEFVIAYGCGKWRTALEGFGGWEHHWEGAVRGLARAAKRGVRDADTWLRPPAACVVGYPERGRDDLASDTWLLAMRFKHPEHPLHLGKGETLQIQCTVDGAVMKVARDIYEKLLPAGAKAVFSVVPPELITSRGVRLALGVEAKVIVTARDDETRIDVTLDSGKKQVRLDAGESAAIPGPASLAIWECSCGSLHCHERHRLVSWNPSQVSLWAFVASAVKGPQPTIQTGSFVAGMYFPLLSQEGF
jgi:hypothetical protein